MKMVVAIRPMMMAAKRPLMPVLVVRNAPLTSAVAFVVASMVTVTVWGIMMTRETIPTTTQAIWSSKRLFLAKQYPTSPARRIAEKLIVPSVIAFPQYCTETSASPARNSGNTTLLIRTAIPARMKTGVIVANASRSDLR